MAAVSIPLPDKVRDEVVGLLQQANNKLAPFNITLTDTERKSLGSVNKGPPRAERRFSWPGLVCAPARPWVGPARFFGAAAGYLPQAGGRWSRRSAKLFGWCAGRPLYPNKLSE